MFNLNLQEAERKAVKRVRITHPEYMRMGTEPIIDCPMRGTLEEMRGNRKGRVPKL